MQEKENIEELFRDAFKNYEEPVSPELWSKVSSSINPAPVQPEIADLATNISSGSGILGNVATWIAGAAIVVSSGIGVYYLVSNQNDNSIGTVPATTSEIASQEPNISNNIEQVGQSEITETFNNNPPVPTSQPKTESIEKIAISESAINTETSNQLLTPTASDKSSEGISGTSQQTASQPKAEITPVNDAKQNITPGQNSTTTRSQIRAYPITGKAPLSVDFSYSGESSKTEWTFGDGNSQTSGNMTQYIFEKPGTYEVTLNVTDQVGRAEILTQTIYVEADMDIKDIPNYFTPNNDGFNDIFKFDAPNVQEIEVAIHDKSGKIIYKWTNIDGGWDGKLKTGEPASEGTYFYVIFATGENGQKNKQTGTITLDR